LKEHRKLGPREVGRRRERGGSLERKHGGPDKVKKSTSAPQRRNTT